MKTDIKTLLEIAGVPMDSPAAEKLIEMEYEYHPSDTHGEDSTTEFSNTGENKYLQRIYKHAKEIGKIARADFKAHNPQGVKELQKWEKAFYKLPAVAKLVQNMIAEMGNQKANNLFAWSMVEEVLGELVGKAHDKIEKATGTRPPGGYA